ncbi:DUF6443 domain-containing protein [Flagellimonas sp.]|uniref:DUF6443 domain-containing protein n=1 Tax=Flagellimonas sp. TaxID=2058762 RepID=UPI003BB00FE9
MNKYTYSMISSCKLASTLLILFFGITTYAQVTLQVPASAVVGDSITVSLSSSAGTDTQWWLEGSAQATIFGSNNNALRLIMTSSGTLVVRARILDDTTVIYDLTESFPVSGGVPNDPGNPTVLSNNCGAPVLQRTGFTTETGDTWYWQGTDDNGFHTNMGSGSTYTASGSGTYYIRARSTTGEWSPGLGSVTVTANDLDPGSITITGTQIICYGTDSPLISSSEDASHGTTYDYQWQVSTNNSTWTNVTGETNEDFDPSANLTSDRWYRRGVTSCGDTQTVYTTPIKVTVMDPLNAGTLNTVAKICFNGDPPNLTSDLGPSNGSVYSYRWESSVDDTNWNPITGETLSTYDPPAGLTTPTYYRKVVMSCGQTDETPSILVDVYDPLTAGSIQGEQVLCYGANPGPITNLTLPAGGKNDYEYVWESSPSGADGTWTPITGEDLANYIPDPNATATTYYRRGVKSCNYTLFAEVPVKIEVLSQLQAPTGTMSVDICSGASASLVLVPDSNANSIRWYAASTGGPPLLVGTIFETDSLTSGASYYAASYDTSTQCESASRTRVDVNIVSSTTYYQDVDNDGLGDPGSSLTQCEQPPGYVLDATDACPLVYDPTNACTIQPPSANAQDHNYLYTRTYQQSASEMGITTNDSIPFFTENDALLQEIAFFDGLGRPTQHVGIDQTPNKGDIVSHVDYDNYGRQAKEYLPYSADGTIGQFNIDPLAGISQLYNTTKYENTTNPYSEKDFEPSPTNRVLKQAAPGNDWALGQGHEIGFTYGYNSLTDNVRHFEVQITVSGNMYQASLIENSNNSYYGDKQLHKHIVYDENHTGGKNNSSEEFTDKQGRVVLKRTYADFEGQTEVPHDTYYVYDEYGNLTFVLPPQMGASLATISNINSAMAELGYQYTYDQRNRLVEKQLPGKAREYLIYNSLDLPIMTQDSVQRVTGEWLFTKYDAFGRVAYTGKAVEMDGANPRSRVDVQANANNESDLWETRGSGFTMTNMTVEYSNNTYPNTSVSELLTINYYDDHTFDTEDEPTPPNTVFSHAVDNRTKGLPTGTKVRVLDPMAPMAQQTWITTITRYDAKGRAVYNYSENDYLQTVDLVTTQLDFVGKPKKVRSQHTRNNNTVVTIDNFTYDHSGRLLKQTQCIGDETLGESCGNIIYDNVLVLDQPTYTTNQTATDRIEVKATNNPVTLSGTLTLQVDPTANSGGGGSANEELIVYNDYDELGQLTGKKIGGTAGSDYTGTSTALQTVDYTYNVRGWLKSINEDANVDGDLFDFSINYNTVAHAGSPLYNGNISETQWKTANDNVQRWYHYGYDALNRITGATSYNGDYDVSNITYDLNGNIQSLQRQGNTGLIDNLTYAYHNTDTSNRLLSVADSSGSTEGFLDGATGTIEYTYDANGNLKTDTNKGITAIGYNHLNLPTSIAINSGTITYIYDATGIKQKKLASLGGNTTVTEYAGNYIYSGNGNTTQLEFLSHAEGYITPSGVQGSYDYVYQYKDHLGNIRLSFVDNNGTTEIVEENNYYPFGLKHKGYNEAVSELGNDVAQRWKFGDEEFEEDLDKNTVAYQWRDYDPAIGRFNKIDRFAEDYVGISPYGFTANNPIQFREIAGDSILVTVRTRGANNQVVEQNLYWDQDQNGNYAFIDTSSGNTYQGSDQFVSDLTAGLNDLMNGGQVGHDLVSQLAGDQNKSVEILKSGGNNADDNGTYVKWNPNNTNGPPDGGNNQRPAFIGLGHELAHIQDVWNGGADQNTWFTVPGANGAVQSVPNAEIYSTHVENQLRAENNLPLRTSYAADPNGNPSGPSLLFPNSRQSRYYNSNGNTNQNYRPIRRRRQTPFTY